MGTTQAVIARLESGRTKPSLERLAQATGMRLRISFEPVGDGVALAAQDNASPVSNGPTFCNHGANQFRTDDEALVEHQSADSLSNARNRETMVIKTLAAHPAAAP